MPSHVMRPTHVHPLPLFSCVHVEEVCAVWEMQSLLMEALGEVHVDNYGSDVSWSFVVRYDGVVTRRRVFPLCPVLSCLVCVFGNPGLSTEYSTEPTLHNSAMR